MGECNHEMLGLPYPAFRRVNAERGDGSPRRLPLRRKTDGPLTDRPTRAEMGDPALCWFNPPSAPPDYRSDPIGPSEFPTCQVDESDREPDLLRREGGWRGQEFHPAKTPGRACCNLTALWAFPHSWAIILAYGMVNAGHLPGDWRQREIAPHG